METIWSAVIFFNGCIPMKSSWITRSSSTHLIQITSCSLLDTSAVSSAIIVYINAFLIFPAISRNIRKAIIWKWKQLTFTPVDDWFPSIYLHYNLQVYIYLQYMQMYISFITKRCYYHIWDFRNHDNYDNNNCLSWLCISSNLRPPLHVWEGPGVIIA